jgi:hypothetical protein
MAVAQGLEVADGLQKIHVLDFSSHVPAVHRYFSSERSVRSSSTEFASTSSHPANGTDALGLDGSNLWNGLVDDLEGKALGERLGDCRESNLRSYFPSAIHYPLATGLGPSPECVVHWSSRIGCVPVARQTGQRVASVLRNYQS